MLTRRRAVLAVVGVASGVALLLVFSRLLPPAPGHPGAPTDPSAAVIDPIGGALIPPADPLPWATVTWRRVDDPLGVFGGNGRWPHRIDKIVSGPAGSIATGRGAGRDEDGDWDAQLIWTSVEGTLWQRAILEAGVPIGNTAEANALAAGPRGIVLLGGTCCRPEEKAAWFSADGSPWIRIPAAFGGMEGVMDVAAGPAGFAAVGAQFEEERMRIWFSPDGRSWEPVGDGDGDLGAGRLTSVVWAGDGFVAAGVDTSAEHYDAAVWRSDDGRAWERVAANDPTIVGADDTEFDSLVAFAGGVFAAGRRNPVEERKECEELIGGAAIARVETSLSCGWGRTTLWVSKDGRRWRGGQPVAPAPGGAMPAGRPMDYHIVRAGGPGLVNVIQADDGLLVWVSADGLDWKPVTSRPPMPPKSTFSDLVIYGRHIVAVGEEWDPDAPNEVSRGVVWIGEAAPF